MTGKIIHKNLVGMIVFLVAIVMIMNSTLLSAEETSCDGNSCKSVDITNFLSEIINEGNNFLVSIVYQKKDIDELSESLSVPEEITEKIENSIGLLERLSIFDAMYNKIFKGVIFVEPVNLDGFMIYTKMDDLNIVGYFKEESKKKLEKIDQIMIENQITGKGVLDKLEELINDVRNVGLGGTLDYVRSAYQLELEELEKTKENIIAVDNLNKAELEITTENVKAARQLEEVGLEVTEKNMDKVKEAMASRKASNEYYESTGDFESGWSNTDIGFGPNMGYDSDGDGVVEAGTGEDYTDERGFGVG